MREWDLIILPVSANLQKKIATDHSFRNYLQEDITFESWKTPIQVLCETNRPQKVKKLKRQNVLKGKLSEPIGKKFKEIQKITEMLKNADETTVNYFLNTVAQHLLEKPNSKENLKNPFCV